MIILSLGIPQDLVRAGAFLLSFLMCVHARRPHIRMETLKLRLSSLEDKLQDAVDIGIMRQSDLSFMCPQYTLSSIRCVILDLNVRTLMTSGAILQEIKAVLEGLSREINTCIRNVKALERDLEVCSSELLLFLV